MRPLSWIERELLKRGWLMDGRGVMHPICVTETRPS